MELLGPRARDSDAAMRIMAREFAKYDVDESGALSYAEFAHVVQKLVNLTRSDVRHVLLAADTRRDGVIRYEEFLACHGGGHGVPRGGTSGASGFDLTLTDGAGVRGRSGREEETKGGAGPTTLAAAAADRLARLRRAAGRGRPRRRGGKSADAFTLSSTPVVDAELREQRRLLSLVQVHLNERAVSAPELFARMRGLGAAATPGDSSPAEPNDGAATGDGVPTVSLAQFALGLRWIGFPGGARSPPKKTRRQRRRRPRAPPTRRSSGTFAARPEAAAGAEARATRADPTRPGGRLRAAFRTPPARAR